VYYDFGLVELLKRMFRRPDAPVNQEATPRDASCNAFFNSEYAQWMDDVTDRHFTNPNNVVLDGSADALQTTKSKHYATTVFLMRVRGVPSSLLHSLANTMTVVLVPGPHEPSNLGPFIKDTMDAIADTQKPGGGLTLVRRRREARNTVETFTVKGVKIFLALWMADFPGRSRP
jgi:hypothetical protein